MRASDKVVYIRDVLLYGTGIVERTLPNGQIAVRFDEGDEELFSPPELELFDVWAEREERLANVMLPNGKVVPKPVR